MSNVNRTTFVVNSPNIRISHSARQPRQALNVPVATVHLQLPAQQYREEVRTRYYGDQFMTERVLVPVDANGRDDDSLSSAIRGFFTWLLG